MLTDREKAKEGGFAQVREALLKFKGRVVKTDNAMWGGQLVDEKGNKRPPREYFEIETTDNEVLEAKEELTMDISEKFSIRINCSDSKGSFWVDMFLASADKFKVLIPGGIKDKIVTFEKQTLENKDPKFNKTDWVIAGVENAPAGAKPASTAPQVDPLEIVYNLALGKTEAELQSAISMSPALTGLAAFPMAQSGMLTQALVKANRLKLVDGKYQKV